MAGFAKAILASIVVAIVILMFSNLIFFFPWYMSVVYETFDLSQAAASDNYLKAGIKEKTLETLKEKPIFNKYKDDIKITAVKVDSDGKEVGDAIGEDKETNYFDVDDDNQKPYRQRGEKIRVTLEATYPFSITVAGKTIDFPFHVSFSLNTTGLRYYKDLDHSIYDDLDQNIYSDVPEPVS